MTPVLSSFKFKPLKEEIQQIAEIPIIQEPFVDKIKSEDMLETIENKLKTAPFGLCGSPHPSLLVKAAL